MLGLSAKIYPKTLSLAATFDPRIIFIILIITLNLHNLSLSKPGCNTGPKSIGCESSYKVVSLKRKKPIRRKKPNEEKEKKSELTGLTL